MCSSNVNRSKPFNLGDAATKSDCLNFSRASTPSTRPPGDDLQDVLFVEDEDTECDAYESSVNKVADSLFETNPCVIADAVNMAMDEHLADEEFVSVAQENRYSMSTHYSQLKDKSAHPSSPGLAPIEQWLEPERTLILLDFDDTLCPSTHKQMNPKSAASKDKRLERHESAVIEFLQVAASLGQVQIVTMATHEWVRGCITELMPGLQDALREMKIPVISARCDTPPRSMREAVADSREPSQFLKTRIMKRFMRPTSSDRGENSQGSWKNVLSIGDSEAERLALQDFVFHSGKDCYCKTVLLLPHPTLEELTAQTRIMLQLLPGLVQHDSDFDLDFKVEDVLKAL